MTKFDKISKRLDNFRDDMINLMIKLCAIPAIAPSNGGEGEVKKAEFLLDFLKEAQADNTELIKAPDLDAACGYRPNILAFFKGKNPAKTVWIMTHMDVVPPGEVSLWKGNAPPLDSLDMELTERCNNNCRDGDYAYG
jgi:succinyl-diaminopimelate desuccinylase